MKKHFPIWGMLFLHDQLTASKNYLLNCSVSKHYKMLFGYYCGK